VDLGFFGLERDIERDQGVGGEFVQMHHVAMEPGSCNEKRDSAFGRRANSEVRRV